MLSAGGGGGRSAVLQSVVKIVWQREVNWEWWRKRKGTGDISL